MAKQPAFRLESLLALKARLVEAQEAELAALLAEEREAQRRLEAIEKARRDRRDALRQQAQQGSLNCGDLSGYWAVMGGLDRVVERQAQIVAEVGQRVEAKRADLLKLVQEKKALEKLKEKAVREWQMEVARAEARFIDDLSIAKFARKRAEQQSVQETGK